MTTQRKSKEERVHEIVYSTDSRAELGEHIYELESLLYEYIPMIAFACDGETCPFWNDCNNLVTCTAYAEATSKMFELGMEVSGNE